MTVTIYQFCKAFNNVHYSDEYKCYVSGGYAFNQIALPNQTIPEQIHQAVINGYFKLHDNYPPQENDFALIAREIDDKYSVLAVANGQINDDGWPTIGYKYFWLEKSSPEVDGIGTLIYWWSEKQPQFDMAELFETSQPEIFYYQEYLKPTFQEPWLQDTWQIAEKLNKIPCTTTVRKHDWNRIPEYMKIHYLALALSQRANFLNAWAWNVRKIAHPENFISISYAEREYVSNISKRQLVTESNNDEFNYQSNNVVMENAPLPVINPIELPSQMVKKIKTCLLDIARIFNHQNRLDTKKTEELFGYLTEYPQADLSQCIDKTMLKNSAINDSYPQLIYMIVPEYPASQEWLLAMIQSWENESKSTSFFDEVKDKTKTFLGLSDDKIQNSILKFQQVFLEYSYDYNNYQVIDKIENSMYCGINFLLGKFINPNMDVQLAQKFLYFFKQSQTMWSYYFLQYAQIFEKIIFDHYRNLQNTHYVTILDFCEPIISIIDNIEYTSLENRKNLYGQYKNLAIIFAEMGYNQSSELFYRISGYNSNENMPNIYIYKENPNHHQREYHLSKSIFGFLLFVFGSAIFFDHIKDWTGIFIFIPITVLILSSIIAILLTGNPLQIGNKFKLKSVLSYIYIMLTVTFLIIGISIGVIQRQLITEVKDNTNICNAENMNFFENYETYSQCYLTADYTTQIQQIKQFFLNPNSYNTEVESAMIMSYISGIKDEDHFNIKIAQFRECKNKVFSDFGECILTKQMDDIKLNSGKNSN
ncbi:hypothetical protein H6F32_00255 [Anabaena sp. FACHB-1237]|uniref:hypothetical protein n=1 Tax=Anabaena sp. FACHB-1237 TaxID=2692769 RepID=UPI001681BE3A|nr:hypothetical protein [Anabaena sp. FACHB-1237]MBD2136049.1 hypothetical protein [Anabaena sp. FACHB-1237]